jgi:radical SAM superfamily enzyme YgiQ (UPF0313 family)
MSSLGFQLVYALLNEQENVCCERFFLPDKGQPLLSLESGRPLHDFPYVFFSVSFEYDYLNIVKILLAAGIEPFAMKRHLHGKREHFVVCGGVATFMNPEPIAPFADFFLVGEAEPVLAPFVDFLLEFSQVLSARELYIAAAQKFDGVYAPLLYAPYYDERGRCSGMLSDPGIPSRVKRVYLPETRKAGHSELMTPLSEFSDLYLTELGRGCSRGCRFCTAAFIYRPPRLWDADAVVEALAEMGADVNRVGLLGMEMADDQTLDRISGYILESGCALSFSSLRADRINDKLLELLGRSGLKSVAIAPDGASERLRCVINKGLSREDLLTGARRLVQAGIFKLKLYVMVGLPTETLDDLREFVELVLEIKKSIDSLGRERGRLTEMYLSVNCFIPKPWTPFQFHPFGISRQLDENEVSSLDEALGALRSKIAFLKRELGSVANIHFQADKPDNALYQALLARGDRRLADVLHDMAVSGMSWKKAVKKNGIILENLILAGYGAQSFFPWYSIDHGIRHDHLFQEYMKGFSLQFTSPCDPSICCRCGVCGER